MTEHIHKYHAFLTTVLEPELVQVRDEKKALLAELQEWEDLESNLDMLSLEGLSVLKTQVDIGSGILCKAQVQDAQKVFVHAGLGFHVECSPQEAKRIVGLRKAALEARLEQLTQKVAATAAHVAFVEGALQQLAQLSADGEG